MPLTPPGQCGTRLKYWLFGSSFPSASKVSCPLVIINHLRSSLSSKAIKLSTNATGCTFITVLPRLNLAWVFTSSHHASLSICSLVASQPGLASSCMYSSRQLQGLLLCHSVGCSIIKRDKSCCTFGWHMVLGISLGGNRGSICLLMI